MASYLLDSTVIIDALTFRRGRAQLLEQIILEGGSLGCCSINVTEIYAGARPGELARTEELLRSMDFYEITWEIAKVAGLLRRDYAKRGKVLSLSDVTIAAVAIENRLTLLTDNRKDFPMPELSLYPLPAA